MTEKDVARRNQTYETIMRQCLQKRGYALDAPPVVDRSFGAPKP